MNVFYLNLIIACVWLWLAPEPTPLSFGKGFIIGFFILYLCERLFENSHYTKRILSFVTFLFAFLKAFIVSNITVAKAVLTTPNNSINPGILTYDTSHLTLFETLLLSQCITLTPGTTTIDISNDHDQITIHAFDGKKPNVVRKGIKKELEAPILRFTR